MRCEWAVERAFLARGFSIVAHRFETPYGELDLLFHHPNGIFYACEVKSCSDPEVIGYRVGQWQIKRLRRIHAWLINQFPGARFFVAFVSLQNRIRLLELGDF